MKTNNALLKLMVLELQKKKNEDVIPRGYFSMPQIIQESGKCATSVKSMVYKAIKDGKMERKMFLALTSNGSLHKLPFFKYLKK